MLTAGPGRSAAGRSLQRQRQNDRVSLPHIWRHKCIKILRLDSQLLNRGLEGMRERMDKDWSLTDCISFVVIEDEGIREALTA